MITAHPGSGRKSLLLSDAFNKGDWSEGSYTPVDEREQTQAMATTISCLDHRVAPIEFRFSQVNGTLTVNVAQDLHADNSDLELEFSLIADGRQLDSKNITFKGKAALSTQVAGVSVLRVGLKLSPGKADQCDKGRGGDARALITSITLDQ